jgi:hypothetical protein
MSGIHDQPLRISHAEEIRHVNMSERRPNMYGGIFSAAVAWVLVISKINKKLSKRIERITEDLK